GAGNYGDGDDLTDGWYAKTTSDTISTHYRETGNHASYSYTQLGTVTTNSVISESEFLPTADYALSGGSGTLTSLTESASNAVGSSTQTLTSTTSDSLSGPGNDDPSSAYVALTRQGSTGSTVRETGNQMTYNYTRSVTSNDSHSQYEAGNEVTGAYSL